jgi:tRNA dimethylallyltransferase
MSQQKTKRPEPHESANRLRLFVLNPPRAELYQRINNRTEGHFAAGLVDEVKGLLSRGVPANSNALGAHGYRRVVEYLEGRRDLPSAIEQTKQDVRNYAKRQLTWFRREPNADWFEDFGEDPGLKDSVLEKLQSAIEPNSAG